MDKRTWQSCWEVPSFPPEEGERRHRKIRDLMGVHGIDCLIIAGHTGNYKSAAKDIRYVSNFCPWFDEQYIVFPLEEEPVISAWSPGQLTLIESKSFIPAWIVSKEAKVPGTVLTRDYAGDIANRIKELGLERGIIGISSMRTMPATIYIRLKEELPYATFVEGGGIIRECRMIYSPLEIEFIRKAGEIGDKGFEAMLGAAQAGVAEAELFANCESAMIKAGAEPGNFILIGSGPWSERAGSIPYGGSQRKLEKGGIILSEITACYGGYHVQLVRTISLGPPPDDFMREYEIHLEVYDFVRQQLKPGNVIPEIESAAHKLASSRWDFHKTEGIALQSCELNDVAVYHIHELRAGMCWVNHPWLADPSIREGRPGIGRGHVVGDTYIIQEDGAECVSKLPKELSIV